MEKYFKNLTFGQNLSALFVRSKQIPIEFLLAIFIAIAAIGINTFYYHDAVSMSHGLVWLVRYFAFGNAYIFLFLLFIYFTFLKKFYISATELLISYFLMGRPIKRSEILNPLFYLIKPFLLLAPLSIIAGPLSSLLANISHQWQLTTKDLLFLNLDVTLFQSSPFIFLPSSLSRDFTVYLFESAYFSLGTALSVMFIIAYVKNNRLFRNVVLSFLCSTIISFPLFYFFPCQGPANFFLHPFQRQPASATKTLQTYRPSLLTSHITAYIEEAQRDPYNNHVAFVSCFPSMHAVWAFFVIYVVARVTGWSLFVTIPWAAFLLIGGLYFAQHYFVDYLIALPVALLSIELAQWLLRFEERWKKGNQKKPSAAF